MPEFDHIEFNTRSFDELRRTFQTDQIPNALLFYGKPDTRKKEAAFFFAAGANCTGPDEKPCGQCRPCKKINARLHPDIHTIELLKGKKAVVISQVREMAAQLSARPNEARTRVVIMFCADQMNSQAQNGLLKLLEEPPVRTVFVLLAQKKEDLLPTIRSRCRKIRFRALTEQQLAQYLAGLDGVDPTVARIAAQTASGSLDTARILLNQSVDGTIDTDWLKRRHWLLSRLAGLSRGPSLAVSQALALSRKLCDSPDLLDNTLAVMKTFFRDLIVYPYTPDKIVNLDFKDTFADIIQQNGSAICFSWLAELHETEKRLLSNTSPRLAMDRFLLKLAWQKGARIYD